MIACCVWQNSGKHTEIIQSNVGKNIEATPLHDWLLKNNHHDQKSNIGHPTLD